MSKNDKLLVAAQSAIEELFSDTSVDSTTARENLTALIDDLETKRSSLDEDE